MVLENFLKMKLRKKSASKSLDFMVEIHDLAHSLDISQEQQKWFKAILTWGFSNLAESQCRGDLLINYRLKNKKIPENY